MSRLLESYANAKTLMVRQEISQQQYSEVVKNRAEFTAHYCIATATSIDGVQLMLSLDQAEYSPAEWLLITQAIKIRATTEGPDVFQFFKQLKRTSYLFACLMIIFLKQKYLRGIETIKKGLGPRPWPLDLVSSQLNLSL